MIPRKVLIMPSTWTEIGHDRTRGSNCEGRSTESKSWTRRVVNNMDNGKVLRGREALWYEGYYYLGRFYLKEGLRFERLQ